jgi:hypothetical protein
VARTTLTIRGFAAVVRAEDGAMKASFSKDMVHAIEVPETAHLMISEEGRVTIGYDARNVAEEGQPERWGFSRQVTYPAWRVVEVETIS